MLAREHRGEEYEWQLNQKRQACEDMVNLEYIILCLLSLSQFDTSSESNLYNYPIAPNLC